MSKKKDPLSWASAIAAHQKAIDDHEKMLQDEKSVEHAKILQHQLEKAKKFAEIYGAKPQTLVEILKKAEPGTPPAAPTGPLLLQGDQYNEFLKELQKWEKNNSYVPIIGADSSSFVKEMMNKPSQLALEMQATFAKALIDEEAKYVLNKITEKGAKDIAEAVDKSLLEDIKKGWAKMSISGSWPGDKMKGTSIESVTIDEAATKAFMDMEPGTFTAMFDEPQTVDMGMGSDLSIQTSIDKKTGDIKYTILNNGPKPIHVTGKAEGTAKAAYVANNLFYDQSLNPCAEYHLKEPVTFVSGTYSIAREPEERFELTLTGLTKQEAEAMLKYHQKTHSAKPVLVSTKKLKDIGTGAKAVVKWEFDSSSMAYNGTPVKYIAQLNTDGSVSCNCQGYVIQKKNADGSPKPRRCKHTDAVADQVDVHTLFKKWKKGEDLGPDFVAEGSMTQGHKAISGEIIYSAKRIVEI